MSQERSANGVPDDIEVQWLLELAQYSWDRLRQSTENDRDVPHDVTLRILENQVYPIGYFDAQSNEISISASLVLLYVYFSDIDQVSFISGRNYGSCKIEYQVFLARQMEENRSLIENGQLPYSYWPPEKFGALGNSCSSLGMHLPLAERFLVMRDQRVGYGLGFTYLHELGHKWYGHRPVHVPSGQHGESLNEIVNERFCASRTQEYEADFYAVDIYAKYGEFNAVEISPFFDVVGIDVFTLLSDRVAYSNLLTHPAGSEREFRSELRMFSHARAAGASFSQEYAEILDEEERLYKILDRKRSQLWDLFPWKIPNPEDCRP